MEKTFEGSIPAFIAAFTKRRRLSREDVTEIRQMLDKLAGEEEKLSDLQEESKG